MGLTVCSAFALSAMAATMTGYISDSHCQAKHMDGSEKSAKCVAACIKGGSDAVFVDAKDSKVYKITDKSKVMDYLGKKVKVDAAVEGDTVTVNSVEAAK
jgi:hypothetical protein